MALNIKNPDVEFLVEEVTRITGESKTEAVRKALAQRMQRLTANFIKPKDLSTFLSFLEDEIWSQIPTELLGKEMTKAEREEILGYGEFGV